jgi:hypothetical protein
MNTVSRIPPQQRQLTPPQFKSVWYGWASLIAGTPSPPTTALHPLTLPAGGIAYGLAKRSIAQDRQERLQDDRAQAQKQRALKDQEARFRAERDVAASDPPSSQARPPDGGPGAEKEGEERPRAPLKKSKYEAAQVFRSQKGDRLR